MAGREKPNCGGSAGLGVVRTDCGWLMASEIDVVSMNGQVALAITARTRVPTPMNRCKIT
jgi:hypothetical protein